MDLLLYNYKDNDLNEEENFDLNCLAMCLNVEKINLKASTKVLTTKIMNIINVCNKPHF